MSDNRKINRRDILKGLAVLPILGYFGFSFARKKHFDFQKAEKHKKLLSEFGLDFSKGLSSSKIIPSYKKNNLLRVGIIGLGNRGVQILRSLGYVDSDWLKKYSDNEGKPDVVLSNFFNQGDLNIAITAVCDVFELRLLQGIKISKFNHERKDYSGKPAKGYKDYKELLEDTDVDAVVIATPDFWHARMSIDAINADKHVYCEKGLTCTEEETIELFEVAKKSKKIFQVGHQYLQNDVLPRAKELINKNKLGKITLVETSSNRNSPDGAWVRHLNKDGRPKPGNPETIDWDLWLGNSMKVPFNIERYYNWSLWWDYSTGLIGQLMSHEYDMANQLLKLGIPQSVTAEGGVFYYKDNRETPDLLNVVCNFPDKDISFLYSASLASNRDRGRILMGNDASVELGNSLKFTIDSESTQYAKFIKNELVKPGEVFYEYKSGVGELDALASVTEQYYASKGLTYTIRNGLQTSPTYLHLKEWLDCIRFDGIPSCNIDKGFEVAITCVMAAEAYREKRRVEWDPVKKRIV